MYSIGLLKSPRFKHTCIHWKCIMNTSYLYRYTVWAAIILLCVYRCLLHPPIICALSKKYNCPWCWLASIWVVLDGYVISVGPPKESSVDKKYYTHVLVIQMYGTSELGVASVVYCINHSPCKPGPKVIKLFSCSTQLSTKFQLLIKTKIPTN